MHLPVIVGFGGVNAAGRSSFHHAYHRTVLDSVDGSARERMFLSLASMMNLTRTENGSLLDQAGKPVSASDIENRLGQQCLDGTLIRRIESNLFDADHVPGNSKIDLVNGQADKHVVIPAARLPRHLPVGCTVKKLPGDQVELTLSGEAQVRLGSQRKLAVQSAGQLPSGFDPAALYASRFHPRGLQLTVVAASDAVKSIGIDWEQIRQKVRPDQICVYAGSSMGQLDQNSTGGMTQARLQGNRVTSKQLALGMSQMPADFVNAYILGSVGATGCSVGACASFLYNLRTAIEEIKSGKRRVAVVGSAEAPITPELIEGFAAMGALATDDKLRKLDELEEANHRRASRPFGENCGFVIAESAQYVVLFDDALALELGANIHGAVGDVFVNADGTKKSISSPGPGNYITMAKAVASIKAIFGEDMIRSNSFIQAHGSSTPQNRVTESRIFDQVAQAFDISDWPVTAIKAHIGHSLGPASADQLINSLGVFERGVLPGISTIDQIADDVYADRLNISSSGQHLGEHAQIALLNSKGFGGNNATGTILSPALAASMMEKRHGKQAWADYLDKNEKVCEQAAQYDDTCLTGPMQPIYRFGETELGDADISISATEMNIAGFDNKISLEMDNPYVDMVD